MTSREFTELVVCLSQVFDGTSSGLQGTVFPRLEGRSSVFSLKKKKSC
jgi:hypothetical protein